MINSKKLPTESGNFSNLVALIKYRASVKGDKKIYSFLKNDEEESSLTYSILNQKAQVVAGKLQSEKIGKNSVLLLFEPGLDFVIAFFGCLYAGVKAIPFQIPHQRNLAKVENVIKDADVKYILTNRLTIEKSFAKHSIEESFFGIPYIETNTEILKTTDCE